MKSLFLQLVAAVWPQTFHCLSLTAILSSLQSHPLGSISLFPVAVLMTPIFDLPTRQLVSSMSNRTPTSQLTSEVLYGSYQNDWFKHAPIMILLLLIFFSGNTFMATTQLSS